MQLEPMKSTLKALGTQRLKRKYDGLLQSFAFNFNLRRYAEAAAEEAAEAWRCRLTLSNLR